MATKASSAQNLLTGSSSSSSAAAATKSLAEAHKERLEAEAGANDETSKGRVREEKFGQSKWKLGEGDVQLDKEKLAEALREEKKRKKRGEDDDDDDHDDHGRRKKYNSFAGDTYEVTEEELGKVFHLSCTI